MEDGGRMEGWKDGRMEDNDRDEGMGARVNRRLEGRTRLVVAPLGGNAQRTAAGGGGGGLHARLGLGLELLRVVFLRLLLGRDELPDVTGLAHVPVLLPAPVHRRLLVDVRAAAGVAVEVVVPGRELRQREPAGRSRKHRPRRGGGLPWRTAAAVVVVVLAAAAPSASARAGSSSARGGPVEGLWRPSGRAGESSGGRGHCKPPAGRPLDGLCRALGRPNPRGHQLPGPRGR